MRFNGLVPNQMRRNAQFPYNYLECEFLPALLINKKHP